MKRPETDRLRRAFEGGKALVTFMTAGDPDVESTGRLIIELEKAGADVIELGVPFSDPMADGPTIQASSERALKNGVTLATVLDIVREARRHTSIPIVLFGYYNPIYSYGVKRFAADAKAAGADGALVVDLPPEEAGELKAELDRNGLDLIFLLTPTSDAARMRIVASMARGFIYFVSLTGVTGARSAVSGKVAGFVREVKRHTDLPVAVGFGVSRPEHAAEISKYADGVVVGSALVNVIAERSGTEEMLTEAAAFVAGLKNAMKGAPSGR